MQEEAGPSRSRALDGARGFAACAVAFYHAILHHEPALMERVLYRPLQSADSVRDALTKVGLILLNGEVAVFLFFVLSGCVLTASLRRQGSTSLPRLCAGFTLARAIRLYPPVIVCMAAFYALGLVGVPGFPAFTFEQTWRNALLLAITIHGPSSTVQSELIAVPFILLAFLLRRRFGAPAFILLLPYGVLAIEAGWMVLWLQHMHAYLFAFLVGMFVAEPGLGPLLRKTPGRAWWAALALLVFCRTFHDHNSLVALVVMVGAAALLVAGLLHGERGSLHRLLEGPLAQTLGRLSFSLYLFNVPVLYFIWSYTDAMAWPQQHALESGLLVGLLSVLLTVPLAWVSERYVEQPSIALGRQVGRWVRGGSPQPVLAAAE